MYKRLIEEAKKAKALAYAPYSHFRVGAAVMGEDKIFKGSNIENASFGASCCAERVAIFKAVSEGVKKIDAISVTSDSEGFTFPCGICRQVMVEFKIPKVIVINGAGKYTIYDLHELMPLPFDEFNGSTLN